MMATKEYIIWQDTIFMDSKSLEEYTEDLRQMLRDDGADESDLTDDKLNERIEEDNYIYLDDERSNFESVFLPEPILCYADLGRWNGRVSGYREVNTLEKTLYAAVNDCSYLKWYVDGNGNLRGEECHHDGTNYYLYRMWKPGLSEAQRDNLKYKIYCGEASEQDVFKYTVRLGDAIGKIYGWKFTGRKPKVFA